MPPSKERLPRISAPPPFENPKLNEPWALTRENTVCICMELGSYHIAYISMIYAKCC